MDFQAGGNKIKAQRNKIQIPRTESKCVSLPRMHISQWVVPAFGQARRHEVGFGPSRRLTVSGGLTLDFAGSLSKNLNQF